MNTQVLDDIIHLSKANAALISQIQAEIEHYCKLYGQHGFAKKIDPNTKAIVCINCGTK